MKSVGGSSIEFHRCWRCECGAFGFFSSTWMLSASSHQRWVCPRFCLFLLVCFLCSVPTLFSDQSPLANWKCNYSPLHVTGGLSLQRNGNWRVVIVDQGWPLGARRLKGGRWCVSGFGHCSVCFLWWELGWSGGGGATHEVTHCMKLLWWLASWNKSRSFHSHSCRVSRSLCSRAATGVTVIPSKWVKLALEEGRKTTGDPEIHFKQINRACWNMGIMGFHGAWRLMWWWLLAGCAAPLDACKALLMGLVLHQLCTPAAGL